MIEIEIYDILTEIESQGLFHLHHHPRMSVNLFQLKTEKLQTMDQTTEQPNALLHKHRCSL